MKRTYSISWQVVAILVGLILSANTAVFAGDNATIELFFTSDVYGYLKPCG